jgi:hypothetical protein
MSEETLDWSSKEVRFETKTVELKLRRKINAKV